MTDTHECPGCGREGVPNARLSCRPCWYALPIELRNAIWTAWRNGTGAGSMAHLRALAAARTWYRQRADAARP